MVVLIKDQGKRSFSNRSMVVKNDTFDRYVYIYCMYYIGRLVVFFIPSTILHSELKEILNAAGNN